MKVIRVSVYAKRLPYVGGTYCWGPGNEISVADATVIVVDTDAGISGCGEFTPCGENYMIAHSGGARGAAELLSKAVLGEDPRQVGKIERIMDQALKSHGYAKAPFDAACWDILGKAVGQPLWMLLGGKLTEAAPMYRVAPQKPPDQMIAEMEQHRGAGYRQFQVKVGADWVVDIERILATVPALKPGETAFADANAGWRVDHAIRVARATQHLDFYLEQPCQSYEECLQVRARTNLPMKLDECVTDLKMAERIVADRSAEVVCLKVSKQGDLSKSRRMRDYLVEHGIPVFCEDTWGGEITTAAVAHLAASTPQEFMMSSTDLHNYNVGSTGKPGPRTENGCLIAPDEPGLGVEPDFDSLGAPIAVYQ